MPIPTDTLWNIRRLNKVFAISALLMVATILWSVVQDYDKDWRKRQQQGRVWEAALVDEKIGRELTPQAQARIKELRQQIEAKTRQIETSDTQYKQLVGRIRDIEAQRQALEFHYNNLKSNVGVMESQLQDAITAQEREKVTALTARLADPRKQLADEAEKIAARKNELTLTRADLSRRLAEATAMKKELNQLTSDVEGLEKKKFSLQPSGFWATLSTTARKTPLLQFVNPSDRIRQVVLPDVQTDVAFMKITTLDRCATCHVNIQNKDFTREKIVAYLEEQVATARSFILPEKSTGKPTDPSATAANPGVAALPEFWNAWAVKLSPAAVAKNKFRAATLAGTVGKDKPATVTYNGKKVDSFKYDPAAKPEDAKRQDAILVELIKAWCKYDKPKPGQTLIAESANGPVHVHIGAAVDEKTAAPARAAALIYAEVLQKALKDALPAEAYRLLEDRYRFALVDAINPYRKQQGLTALDTSPALLAHPKLELYVDADSKHPMEIVGCSSCHDGSGQETDFVLAAHVARPIWVDRKSGKPLLAAELTNPPKEEHQATLGSLLDVAYPEDAVVPTQAAAFHLGQGDAHKEPPTTAPSSPSPGTPGEGRGEGSIRIADHPPHDAKPTAYVDAVTGASGTAVSQMEYWISRYEPEAPRPFSLVYHEWDRPMLPPRFLQANCVRCHGDSHQVRDEAPVVHKGRALFTQLGCVNCHQMDSIAPEQQRKVGTDLRQVTAKLSPAFINTWVWAPKAFRPSTKMPHFFMLENNSSDEELRRTRQEARAITEYLVQTATPLPFRDVPSSGLARNKNNGKTLFNSLGCLACHSNLNETGEAWITTDLAKRAGMKADEAKKAYAAMSYNQRQLYAMRNFPVPDTGEPLPAYPDKSPRPVFMHVGPELSGIGTKLSAGRTSDQARQWLYQWLKEPRHYSDYTFMPRLRLSDQEAIDLAEYLLDQKRLTQSPDDKWEAKLAEVDAAKLRELTSLFLRSRYSVEKAFAQADDEVELTALAKDALTSEQIPAAAADARVKEMSKQTRQLVFLGKKLISNYGCMQCHAINGMETASSPCANLSDWGQKGIDKLDFAYLDPHKAEELPKVSKVPMVNGLSVEAANLGHTLPGEGWNKPIASAVEVGWPQVHHSRTDWLTQKLRSTRIYDRGRVLLEPVRKIVDGKLVVEDPGKPYDKLKMPTFYLNDDEIHALVTFVISNRDKLVTERLLAKTNTEPLLRAAYGRYLTEKYNCIGCHQVEHNVPAIQRLFKRDEITTSAPPSLRGEGNKIQHAWLFNFLKNVEKLRPLPVIRMPSFPITDEEATAIAAYFNTVSNKESNELQKVLDPAAKYVAAQGKSTTQSAVAGAPLPGDDWWSRPEFAPAREKLVQWALAYDKIRASEIAPTNSATELGKAYRMLLFRATFIQGLYHAPYPFVDSPRPEIAEARFKLGEQFMYDMQCLKCHVMGDPKAPGARSDPTAPNLGLAAQRLQRRWIRHWVQEPPLIQTDTKMPAFFTGEPVNNIDGQSWPRAQNIGEPTRSAIEEKYGRSVQEQTDLLLDFIYAAGVRNYTAVQPSTPTIIEAIPPAPPKPEAPKAEAPQPAKPSELPKEAPPPPPAKAQPSITGKVLFKGQPPQMPLINMAGVAQCAAHAGALEESVVVNPNGTLKNVIVSVSAGLPPMGPLPIPQQPVVLDQQGCMYTPHVVAMMAGQPLEIRNSDPFLHNVHSLAQTNPAFNQAQPLKGAFTVNNLKSAEVFPVKCDVHGWMNAYIGVFDHPFFAVTDDKGEFTISGLPPGNYTLHAWQERYGEQDQQNVTVQEGKPATVEFEFKEE